VSDESIEKIAVVVHEALRAWQRVNEQTVSPCWEEATWERESTLEAVRDALKDPTPGRQHERWREERLAQGWTFGLEKDTEAKTNPALVPFEELSTVEIAKDHLIISITQTLAAVLEEQDA
jgi:hypothetical protein